MAKTAKSQSTISYNTPEYLEHKLKELYDSGKISDWHFIVHDQDTDPSSGETKKRHSHVWLQPNGQINTLDLQRVFVEIIPGEDKPRKCRPFNYSKEDDWTLYVLHDPEYLKTKGLGEDDGRHQYPETDIKTADPDDFFERLPGFRSVIQMPLDRQRDALAEYIFTATTVLSMTNLYDFAQKNGYMDGLLKYRGIIKDLLQDHNDDIDLNNIAQGKAQMLATRYLDAEHKDMTQAYELARNFGSATTTITLSDGTEAPVNISIPSQEQIALQEAEIKPQRKPERLSLWDGLTNNQPNTDQQSQTDDQPTTKKKRHSQNIAGQTTDDTGKKEEEQ